MATLNTAAKAPPAFLTRNYVNGDCLAAAAIQVLSGAAFITRAYDMTGSAWSSQGSNDTITEYYDVTLYTGQTLTPQLVDTILLLGFNGKSFTVRWYYNGAQLGSQTVANYASNSYLQTLSDGNSNPITIDRVRVEITMTQTANAEKTIGVLYVGAIVLQPTISPFEYRPAYSDGIATITMADKTKRETIVYRSASSFTMWSAKLSFRAVSTSLRASLKALRQTRPLVIMPEPGDNIADIFQGRVMPGPAGYAEQYFSISKDAGYLITLGVEELGGA